MIHKFRVILENARAEGLKQPVAEFLRVPADGHLQDIFGELECGLSGRLRPNVLGDAQSFPAKRLARPVALFGGVLVYGRGGVVRIDVAVAALKE